MERKLILTGFMATGKSTVGRVVARSLGWPLFDTDEQLASSAGKSIAEIFDQDGEAQFRLLEGELIAKLAASGSPSVIATGGGALVDDSNYAAMSRSGVIACLSARPEVIAARIARGGAARPKLLEGGKPLRERIAELLEARQSAYARADFTVDTSDASIEEVVVRVLEGFAARGGVRCRPSA